MTQQICPYCKTPCPGEATACINCHVEFPWAKELQRLRDELKEREVNRGRATFTLIDEVFTAFKGGKPLSLAAIKGFAFAWLFPRTAIVIGSILTGILLLAQTIILFNQTQLLQGQTAAAQIEQAEKLRARIPETLMLMKAFETERDGLRYFSGSPPSCDSGCELLVKNLLNELKEKFAVVGITSTVPSRILSKPAQDIKFTIEALVNSTKNREAFELTSQRSLADNLLVAGPRCFAPIDVVEDILEGTRTFSAWKDAELVWNDSNVAKDTLGNLRNANFETLSLGDFQQTVWQLESETRDGLTLIADLCRRQLIRDTENLEVLEGPKEGK